MGLLEFPEDVSDDDSTVMHNIEMSRQTKEPWATFILIYYLFLNACFIVNIGFGKPCA
eukprot:GAHX01006539.1.p2 GENE.GAHX01006539.1~~GAHX01006539.1.p2  ORF type:complete len:58 (+),score=5.52 GAHX01006539.1:184-357(+)